MFFFFLVLAVFAGVQFASEPKDRAFTGVLVFLCLVGGFVYFVLTKQLTP